MVNKLSNNESIEILKYVKSHTYRETIKEFKCSMNTISKLLKESKPKVENDFCSISKELKSDIIEYSILRNVAIKNGTQYMFYIPIDRLIHELETIKSGVGNKNIFIGLNSSHQSLSLNFSSNLNLIPEQDLDEFNRNLQNEDIIALEKEEKTKEKADFNHSDNILPEDLIAQ